MNSVRGSGIFSLGTSKDLATVRFPRRRVRFEPMATRTTQRTAFRSWVEVF